MPESTTYLKKLKFDPRLNSSVFAGYLRNTRLVVLLILLVCVIGVFSFMSLPRVLNPKINIPIVIVSTALPGASPNDIETLVTVPIENGVNNLPKIKTVTSSSQDSVSIVTLEFESGVDADKAKADVKSAVDSVTDLPDNAETPNVEKLDFENSPVWTFTLSSKTDSLSLIRFAKTLRDKLEDLPTVDKVQTTGLDDEEIQILMSPAKLAASGVNPAVVSQAIKSSTGSFPGGTVNTNSSTFVLSLDPTVTSVETLRNIRITANKNSVLLSDIATIQQRTKPDAAVSYIASRDQAPIETIRFDIYKASSANITKAVADAQKLAEETTKPYGDRFLVSSVLNAGEEIDKQYYDLIRDLSITVGLVFFTLFLFLGIRQAVVASLAIPLTFLITFTVMNLTGIALSFIAFFSFLLSLGLLVDDTIVIISALTAYYRTNKFSPIEAGLLVWRDFRTAIITTTLTTVWAFIPLLLSSGIIGEFIKPIPIVVSSALLGSLAVAFFVTLPFIIVLLTGRTAKRVTLFLRIMGVVILFAIFLSVAPKGPLLVPAILLFLLNLFVYFQVKYLLFQRLRNRNAKPARRPAQTEQKRSFSSYMNHGVIDFETFERKYRSILDTILAKKINRRKTVIAVVIFSIFSYLLLPLGFVRNEFFPKSDQEFLYFSLELPTGTNITETRKEVLTIVNDVRQNPHVKFATATLKLGVDPGRGFAGATENSALITIVLPELKDQKRGSIQLAEDFRQKYKNYQKGTFSVIEESGGPPAGSDLQMKLSGDDLAVLDTYADKLQNYLNGQAGVINISKSIKSGTSKIVFVPDYQKLLDAGITQDQLGLWLRTYASGFTLEKDAKLQKGSDEKQDIVLRTSVKPQTANETGTITIPTQNGPVSLLSLGKFELRPNPSLITRENGKRTISVSAGVRPGISSTEKNKDFEKFADSMGLPEGYSWSTGGANEENQASVNSILQAMLLSFFLIIVTMVLQFSSFRKALIVMLVIPLSISGVFIIFALTHTPLGFPALIGVLALFGIVVKNSILIVDKINQNLRQNMQFREAIVDAAESRLEPITLTTFATIAGLIPITISDPFWRGLGGAIIAGLTFSGTMMLFFIPVVYYLVFQKEEGGIKPETRETRTTKLQR